MGESTSVRSGRRSSMTVSEVVEGVDPSAVLMILAGYPLPLLVTIFLFFPVAASISSSVTNVQVSMLNLSANIGLESQNGDLPHSGYSIYTKLHYLVVTNNK